MFLSHYLAPQKKLFAFLTVALLVSIGLQIVNPQFLAYFIDTAAAGGSQSALIRAAIAFIAIALVTQVTTIAAAYWGEKVAWSATNALRWDLAAHCLHLDLSFHKSHTPGELLERIDGDVNLLSNFFSNLVIHVLGNGLLLVGILVALCFENSLAGIALSAFAAIALSLLLAQRRIAIAPWGKYRQISAEFYGTIAEQMAAREDVRANGAVSYAMHRFYKLLRAWLPAYQSARLASTILWCSSVGTFAIGNAIALTIAAYLRSQDAITIGNAYLIFHYTNLLAEPIERIREELEQLQQVEASLLRVQELLAAKSSIVDAGKAVFPDGACSVRFDRVCFKYDPGDPDWILEDLSFTLEPGEVLGIVGRTGSGKSTIARLLLRLCDRQSGSIFLGDLPIESIPLSQLRQKIGFVTQDVQLFQATVRDNLTFFDRTIPDELIVSTIEMLGLGTWLRSLPQFLDTQLGAGNCGLSAGQAQLLAFVRVFLKNPSLVILDEASSRVDPETEACLEQAIDLLLRDRTGIIIAHRQQSLQRVDRILKVGEEEE